MFFDNEELCFSKAVYYSIKPIILPREFWDSTGGPFTHVPLTGWIELYDDNGIVGQAPCSDVLRDYVLPLVLTGEKKTYKQWIDKLYWHFRNPGFSSEKTLETTHIDLAMVDILAKRAQKPLHRFFGATRDWVEVYGSGCGTNLSDKEIEAELQIFMNRGFKKIKMKAAGNFGADLDNDVRRVALVRKIIGNIPLAVDVNQLFDSAGAFAFANRIAKFDIHWYEEPVRADDYAGYRVLAKTCPIPCGAGESMRNFFALDEYIYSGVAHLMPIPEKMLVRDWFAVRDATLKAKRMLSSGGFSQITAAYVATAPEDTFVEDLTPLMDTFGSIMKYAPEEKNGRFYLPNIHGLPVSPDWQRMEKEGILFSRKIFTTGTI